MEKARVYYTDFRTVAFSDGLPKKLQKLCRAAGIGQIDMNGKFVAIKMHFGELGQRQLPAPKLCARRGRTRARAGRQPFLTDCNTMYPGKRKNALEHLECAWENGFTPLSAGCPLLIADGLKGTDDVAVPVAGGEFVKEARIGRAVMDADVFISLTHFKGHEATGFGGAIKNIGMGLRLTRRQEGTAQQRAGARQSGALPRLPPLRARMCKRRARVRCGGAQDDRGHAPLRRLRPVPGARAISMRSRLRTAPPCMSSTAAWPSMPRPSWTAGPRSTFHS